MLQTFDGLVIAIIVLLMALIGGVIIADQPVQGAHPSILFVRLDDEIRDQLFALSSEPNRLTDDWDSEVASSDARQLTDATMGIWDFTTAADGSRLVYSSLNRDGSSDLWEIRDGQTKAKLLLQCPGIACNGPALSPDGQFLAYAQRNAITSDASGGLAPPRLWLLNLKTGDTASIFPDTQEIGFSPSWSASSSWISYLSPQSGNVRLFNLRDGRRGEIESKSGESGVWHPVDDKLLATIMRQIEGQYWIHVHVFDPATDTLVNLSGNGEAVEDRSASWSPDGGSIAFRRKELTGLGATLGNQLWIMQSDGSDARALTADADFDHGQPVWSPDGNRLIYHRFPLKGPDIVLSVWSLDVNSGEQIEILRPGQRPVWWH